MDELTAETDLIGMTADIVSAFVSNNAIAADALPRLIAGVHGALAGTTEVAAPEPEPQAPAVPIRKSITPDHIICPEDGRPFRSMKRHLATRHGLTPEEYRAKWGLPTDIRWWRRTTPPLARNWPSRWASARAAASPPNAAANQRPSKPLTPPAHHRRLTGERARQDRSMMAALRRKRDPSSCESPGTSTPNSRRWRNAPPR